MKTSLTLNEGMKLELDCTSTGDPTPKITWSRLGSQKLSPERVILHTKGLLSLRNVEQGDQGDYKCVASNSLGKDSKTFSVTVMGKTFYSINLFFSYRTTHELDTCSDVANYGKNWGAVPLKFYRSIKVVASNITQNILECLQSVSGGLQHKILLVGSLTSGPMD